jgi:glycosyltransferase involved in cell wall biosynthesis
VVVCQGGNVDGLLWMEACLKLKLRYVVIAQAAAEPWWPDDDEARRLSQCYVGAAASYFVSAANLELSSRQFGSALPRARVIRNPFGVRYDAAPPWPENPTGELRLACVGRLDVKAKGQDILLRVLALPAWRGRSVHLTLAGDGVNRQTLCAMVKNLELNNVQFAGHINDLENFWAQHHVLVLPSRIEGMPLALVEAMLCNRVPIVTDVAGHAELVRDGVNGFLAKAPTVELLNDAMNKVWDAKAQLQTIGSSAGRTVRNWVSEDPVEDFVGDLSALL